MDLKHERFCPVGNIATHCTSRLESPSSFVASDSMCSKRNLEAFFSIEEDQSKKMTRTHANARALTFEQ